MEQKQLLYHYCTEDTFKSIIKSKNLWLTKIIKSNDYEEVARTYDIIWPQIYSELKFIYAKDNGVLQILQGISKQIDIDKRDSALEQMNPFGICFSVNRDLAQNWNEYGDRSRGIAIGFSEKVLYGIKHDMPHPSSIIENAIGWNQVYYDRDDIVPQFVDLFANVLNTDPYAFLTIPNTLRHYRAFIKNPTFQDEREVRIIYYPVDSDVNNSLCKISGVKNNVVLHCELPWNKNDICSIEEIIIGTNCKLTIEDVKRFLVNNGIDDNINVIKSEYPYKLSENRTGIDIV